MRKTKIVGEFGEIFIAQTMLNLGFEVDRLDAEGIDLAAYSKDGQKLGISVKSRCVQDKPNNSINLTYNDLTYTYEQAKNIRDLEPAYAVIVHSNDRIDLLIATQDYICQHHLGITSIEEYQNTFTSKKDEGSTKSFNISLKSREKWRALQDNGIIYSATLSLK